MTNVPIMFDVVAVVYTFLIILGIVLMALTARLLFCLIGLVVALKEYFRSKTPERRYQSLSRNQAPNEPTTQAEL